MGTAVVNIPLCVEPTCFMPPPAAPPPPAGPVLTITKTHVGNFRSGAQGTYTITVCNAGAGPTDSTIPIAVVDTLPAGMTGVSMAGTGWVCNLATLTCVRSSMLAGGLCFPPILLTVSVA